MSRLTAFQWSLLKAATELHEPSGQDIKRYIEQSAFHRSEEHHGRLYPNLNALVDGGLVEKGEIDSRTNYYKPTTKALTMLDERAEFLSA